MTINTFNKYELTDHLGNVRVLLSDVKIPADISSSRLTVNYTADVINAANYYPYGEEISKQTWTGGYNLPSLFGYNGMLKDNHIAGEGNAYYTLFREYAPDLGRWWSADPKKDSLPSFSPYVSMRANPINRIDPKGDADYIYTDSDSEPKVENDWGLVEFLNEDRYFIEVNGKRYQANSKETVELTDWKYIYQNWEFDKERGLNARVDDSLSGYMEIEVPNLLLSSEEYYVKVSSPEGGLLDQKHNLIVSDRKFPIELRDDYARAYLYIYKGIAYNWREAGNIVWGRALRTFDIPYWKIWAGAQLYTLYRYHQFDQPNEVDAFRAGYDKDGQFGK